MLEQSLVFDSVQSGSLLVIVLVLKFPNLAQIFYAIVKRKTIPASCTNFSHIAQTPCQLIVLDVDTSARGSTTLGGTPPLVVILCARMFAQP